MSTWGKPALLEVTSLHSGYGRIPILDGVSFSLQAGEVVGILGHNGMGKTTLLKTLIGEVRATAGEIKFDGRNLAGRPIHERARAGIGYVPQGRGIFPRLSVLENLRMGAGGHGNGAVERIIERVPVLRALLGRPGRALSGGQQQILALARSLVAEPKLLLLDEPTEGIQPSIVDEIAELLASLRQSLGLTILLVEQDLHFIRGLADRVLILQKGRIVAEMAPGQLADPNVVREYLGL